MLNSQGVVGNDLQAQKKLLTDALSENATLKQDADVLRSDLKSRDQQLADQADSLDKLKTDLNTAQGMLTAETAKSKGLQDASEVPWYEHQIKIPLLNKPCSVKSLMGVGGAVGLSWIGTWFAGSYFSHDNVLEKENSLLKTPIGQLKNLNPVTAAAVAVPAILVGCGLAYACVPKSEQESNVTPLGEGQTQVGETAVRSGSPGSNDPSPQGFWPQHKLKVFIGIFVLAIVCLLVCCSSSSPQHNFARAPPMSPIRQQMYHGQQQRPNAPHNGALQFARKFQKRKQGHAVGNHAYNV